MPIKNVCNQTYQGISWCIAYPRISGWRHHLTDVFIINYLLADLILTDVWWYWCWLTLSDHCHRSWVLVLLWPQWSYNGQVCVCWDGVQTPVQICQQLTCTISISTLFKFYFMMIICILIRINYDNYDISWLFFCITRTLWH